MKCHIISPEPPMIMLDQEDVSGATKEGTLTISPTVMLGLPEATLTWMHSGQVLDPATDSRVTISNTGMLTVTDLQSEDRGVYTLTATNIAATVPVSVDVFIECELKFDYLEAPPTLTYF